MSEVTPRLLLSLEHVSLERAERFIVRDVSLSVHQADRIALIGGNGAGKSTLLRLLAGQQLASALSLATPDTADTAVTVTGTNWRAPGVRVMTLPSLSLPTASSVVASSATASSVAASSATASSVMASLPSISLPSLSTSSVQTSHAARSHGCVVDSDVSTALVTAADAKTTVSDATTTVSDTITTVADAAQASLRELRQLEADMRAAEQHLSELEPHHPRLTAALEHYATLQERFERAGGYDSDQRIEQALAAFGLTGEQVLEHLSRAQQQQLRLALGMLRARSFADVLLLDEPERHLDIDSRQQLIAALQSLPVAIVLASHDRMLLDAVTKHVAYVDAGRVHLYRGNYSAFLQQHDSERVRFARLAHKRRRERQALEQTHANAPTAAARKRAKQRLARLESTTSTTTPATPAASAAHAALALGHARRPAETLLHVQHLYVRQLENLTFHLTAGTTVALIGAHGAGKTTLFETLVGQLEATHPDTRMYWANAAKVAHFDDAAGLQDAPVLGQLEAFVSTMRARSLLALVGLAEHADKIPSQLSSGQRARAGLAQVMAQEATVLLLDHPDEHLDVDMKTVLENALLDSPAAILLATHDMALIERVADQVWHLEAGQLHVYANVAAYQRGETLPNLAEPQHHPGQRRLLPGETSRDDNRDDNVYVDGASSLPTLAAPHTPALHDAEQEAQLEQELCTLDEALLDPLRHSERERERFTLRRKQVIDALSWCYEQRQLAPLPAYGAREGVVRVWLDIDNTNLDSSPRRYLRDDTNHHDTNHYDTNHHPAPRTATFYSNATVQGRVFIQGSTGHVLWQLPEDGCVLPWALERVVWGVVRIVFLHLDVRVLQTQYPTPLVGFQAAGDSWQTLTRKRFAWLEGYPPTQTPSRKISSRRKHVL